MTKDEQFFHTILKTEFADDYVAIGDSNVSHLIKNRGQTYGASKHLLGGQDHHVLSMEVILAGITFLTECIRLYREIKASLGVPPSPSELSKKALDGKPNPPIEVDAKKEVLAKEAIDYVNEEHE